MEYLPTIETFSEWLLHHGSWVLFVLLALGIVALPVPEETLMVITGTLIASGMLCPIPTILAAYGGSICGISVSYAIGRTAGVLLIHKYGKWVGIKSTHIDKVHVWFEKFGKWALIVGYFIPGVRHFTGLIAGSSQLHVRQFMLFAYSGAIVWVSTFLSLGYFFGHYCRAHCSNFELTEVELIIAGALCLAAIVAYFIYKRKGRSRSGGV